MWFTKIEWRISDYDPDGGEDSNDFEANYFLASCLS